MTDQPMITPPSHRPSSLPIIVLSILTLFTLTTSAFLFWQNRQLQTQLATLTAVPPAQPTLTVNPTVTPVPLPTETPGKVTQSTTLKTPDNWLTYADETAGITIKYPPEFSAKLNPNRGAGFNYKAGSYLVDSTGNDVLHFFFYSYPGGSRREAFYQGIEFDGPENAASFTQSTADVSLNGKTFLKLVTTYFNEATPRVFYLISQGDRLYYFTYSKSAETNPQLLKNLQTVIATSTLDASTQASPSDTDSTYVYCLPNQNFLKEKGDTWDARMDPSGDLVITQRLNHILESKVIRKDRVQVSANPQTLSVSGWEITNFAVMIDSDQKGRYQDAIVVTIPKAEVNKIIQATPASIPSVSAGVKVNDTLETTTGEWCQAFSAPVIYFTDKP